MSDIPQSDVSRPSKLPTANLLPHGTAPLAIEQTSAEYLEAVEEEWNKSVDVEIETLADGMVDLVNLASVSVLGKFPRKYPSVVLTSAPVVRSTTKINSKSHRRRSKHNSAQSLWSSFSFLCPRATNLEVSMQIRAANSLLSIVHSMKLQLLLSDEAQIVERRDAELATTLQEKEEAKAKVAELLSRLLK